jgi:predicted nucleic acid-binding protein
MPFVLDASIAACWAFDDENNTVATLALEQMRTDQARVPAVWWFEIRNTLVVNERRKRLTEVDTVAFLRGLARLGVTIDRSPVEADVLMLARRHRLTVYDAAYLELARREGLALATPDSALAAAARAESIVLLEDDAGSKAQSLSVILCAGHNRRQGGVLCQAKRRSWSAR